MYRPNALRSVCTCDLGQDSPIQTSCSVNKSLVYNVYYNDYNTQNNDDCNNDDNNNNDDDYDNNNENDNVTAH